MNRLIALWAALLSLALLPTATAQSPNARASTTTLEAANFQLKSERGQANGYVPLGAYVAPNNTSVPSNILVNPQWFLPGFSTATDSTLWAKIGNSLAPLSGISATSGGWTANNVFMGQLVTGVYGIKVPAGASGLFLRGGSSNQVIVDYNNTLGGSDSGRTGLLWYIGPSGTFKLSGGEVNGTINFKTHGGTNITSLAGALATVNLQAAEISTSSGNLTIALPTGAGLVVPSTASAGNPSFAINVVSGNSLYARLAAANTFSSTVTFSSAPIVPDSSFAFAKISGLQNSLDGLLKRDGSNAATGALALGGFKITGVGNPTLAQDAVTLGYLQTNYGTTSVRSLSVVTGSGISVSSGTGEVTLTQQAASGSVPGYLSAANFLAFSAKESALTFSSPLSRIVNSISLPRATSSTSGYLHYDDYVAFSNNSNPLVSRKTSSTIIAADGTEQEVLSYSVPANKLKTGTNIRVRLFGKCSYSGAGQFFTVSLKLGGTTLVSKSTVSSTGVEVDTPFESECTATVRSASTTAATQAFARISCFSYPSVQVGATSSSTVNTTTTQSLSVTVQQDSGVSGRSLTVDQAQIYIQ